MPPIAQETLLQQPMLVLEPQAQMQVPVLPQAQP